MSLLSVRHSREEALACWYLYKIFETNTSARAMPNPFHCGPPTSKGISYPKKRLGRLALLHDCRPRIAVALLLESTGRARISEKMTLRTDEDLFASTL